MITYNPNPGIMDIMSHNAPAVEADRVSHAASEDVFEEPLIIISADPFDDMFVPKISRDGGQTFYQMNVQAASLEKAHELARDQVLSEVRPTQLEGAPFRIMTAIGILISAFILPVLMQPHLAFLLILAGIYAVTSSMRRDMRKATDEKRESVSRNIIYKT